MGQTYVSRDLNVGLQSEYLAAWVCPVARQQASKQQKQQ